MLDYKYEKSYGKIRFNSMHAFDYEESFMEYLSSEEDFGYLSEFGSCKIGEIDNIMMKEFESGFNSYFS